MRLLIGIALAALLLLRSPTTALAVDPSLRISQYAHTRWTVREGAFRDSIGAIAQTPDGYLWLGTQFGLLRFDGVRYVSWEPPPGQHLPSINIRSLFSASDGRLWIGTRLGLASWKDGTLTLHPEVTGHVGSMLEDRNGTVWAGTRYPPPGKLCAFRTDGVQCYGEKGEFGARASSVYEDRAGNLWVGSENALWRWKPGPANRYPLVNFESSHGIIETDEGALVIAERDRLRQLVGEKAVEYQPWINRLNTQFAHMLRDRDGALWIGTLDRGLIRVHRDRVDLFSRADGLSSNYVRGLLEDREGNIWVATDNGLDRFSYTAVSTISADHGLSEGTPWSLLPASDGSVWVGTVSGLNRLKDGRITVYRREGRPLPRDQAGSARRMVTAAGLPHDLIQSLFEDHRQRIWVATHRGVVVFEHGHFSPIDGLRSGVQAFAGDDAGNVWVSEDVTLTHVVGRSVVERIPWTRLEQPGAGGYHALGSPRGRTVAGIPGRIRSAIREGRPHRRRVRRGQGSGAGNGRRSAARCRRHALGFYRGWPEPDRERTGSDAHGQGRTAVRSGALDDRGRRPRILALHRMRLGARRTIGPGGVGRRDEERRRRDAPDQGQTAG